MNAPHNVELLIDMKGYGRQANKGRWCQTSKKLRRKRNVIGRKKKRQRAMIDPTNKGNADPQANSQDNSNPQPDNEAASGHNAVDVVDIAGSNSGRPV